MVLQKINSCEDEQLLDQAIAEFLRAEATGNAGDRHEWLDRYQACAPGLLEFFDDRERVDRLVMPVRIDRPTSGDASTGIFQDPKNAEPADTVDLKPTPPNFAQSRYSAVRFHARGGMGEVWLARDDRIGRRVAIKKLRPEREKQQARFLVEAQVTGQLEHPSVVPMHDLGTDETGQPFYVMKFVEGRDLHEMIAEFHSRKTSTDWTRNVDFQRLLQTFVSVCYAVAYAHSKGVLHRDIKPSNVMVGPYGETLVLDWGLAKVVGQPIQQGDAPVQLNVGDSTTTHDGAIVGTPVYMSPEGALGHTEGVDQSSDVYLLGATLYEILTARPPRQGSSKWELIELARNSQPANPRTLVPQIPRALEAVCLKGMAFCKSDRYPTAIALAEDVQRFMAGEPTVAFREPPLVRLARWTRRHRRGIMRGLVIAAGLAICGFALQSYRQARLLVDREQARAQLSDFYRLAGNAQFYAANSDAVSERVPYYDPRHAMAVGEAALAIVAPWGELAERLPLPEQRAEFLQARYGLLLLLAQIEVQEHSQATTPLAALSLLDKAQAIQRPSRGYYLLRSRCLMLKGDRQAAQQEEERAGDPDVSVTAQDHFLEGELLRMADAGSSIGSTSDETQSRREYLTKAIEKYRDALRLEPRHFWAQFQLGRCLLALGRGPEAVEALSACVAMRPDSPWAYTTRGLATALSGRPEEALVDLDRAMELDPSFQPAKLNRGVVHWLKGDTDAAIADLTAILAAPSDKRLIEARFYRGQLLLKMHRTRDALADLSMTIDARPDFRPAYWLRAQTWFRLGNYDEGQSDLARFLTLGEAKPTSESRVDARFVTGKTLYQMAIELDGEAQRQALVRAADAFRTVIAAGSPTAEMFQHLGAVHHSLEDTQEAIASYSHGLTLSANHVPLRNLRGWAYEKTAQYDLARADFSEAIRLEPGNPDSHAGLGFVAAQTGDINSAQMEALTATLQGADHYVVMHNVACIYGRLSESAIAGKLEHQNLALAALKRALALWRQNSAGPDEIAKIRQERAFPDSLRARPEFQRLLAGQVIGDR